MQIISNLRRFGRGFQFCLLLITVFGALMLCGEDGWSECGKAGLPCWASWGGTEVSQNDGFYTILQFNSAFGLENQSCFVFKVY